MAVFGLDAQPPQLRGDIAAGALAVVGEKQEWQLEGLQLMNEAVGPIDQRITPIDYAIHVDQESVRHFVLFKKRNHKVKH